MKTAQKSEIERRRTFGIIRHPDAGKTPLTKKLLPIGGDRNARKANRYAASVRMAIEQQRSR